MRRRHRTAESTLLLTRGECASAQALPSRRERIKPSLASVCEPAFPQITRGPAPRLGRTERRRYENSARLGMFIAMAASSLTPMLTVKDASAATQFHADAFGAVEEARFSTPTGQVVAELTIDGLRFFVVDENPEAFNVSPTALGGATDSHEPGCRGSRRGDGEGTPRRSCRSLSRGRSALRHATRTRR